MSETKVYQISVNEPADWEIVHELLTRDGTLEDNIPPRGVAATDTKEHSPTRSSYLMTEEEALELSKHPKIQFVNIDYNYYKDDFKAPPEELATLTPQLQERYQTNVRNYREFENSNLLPNLADWTPEYNRSGYQLLRCQQKRDPWIAGSLADNAVISSNISQYGTGKDVDVIVGDDGCWFGHPEFNSATDYPKPDGYTGGNVLPGNGTCDVLDLLLDSPYYLDPAWFNADPGNRLETRWDGTIVPQEAEALNWWALTANRSAAFSAMGTVDLRLSGYTRSRNNGSNTSLSTYGQHGTPCSALTFGRSQGWAYNANKWFVQVYNYYGTDIEPYFDLLKLFHQYKPVNTKYGTKNPTINSNSWGYRASKGVTNGYYHHRNVATQYGGVSNEPDFISHLGQTGDGGRWKSEMYDNSYTQAGKEMIDAGVIFVVASGNSNQKQVGDTHPDWENRVSANETDGVYDSTFYEFGIATTGTTNRRGFPQQLGKYTEAGHVVYPAINVGALDDEWKTGKECKVNYSDRGEQIDLFAPADGTLAANHSYASEGWYPVAYPGLTISATDCAFGGTSAACPVATGFLATVLEHNRGWTWQDIKNWLASLDDQDAADFYVGTETTTPTSSNWFDYNSLEGASPRVIYQGNIQISSRMIASRKTISGSGLRISGNLTIKGG